jgi:hypothetical protein
MCSNFRKAFETVSGQYELYLNTSLRFDILPGFGDNSFQKRQVPGSQFTKASCANKEMFGPIGKKNFTRSFSMLLENSIFV